MSALEVTIDALADLAEFAGKHLGMAGPVGVGVQVAGLVLRGADNVLRELDASELERMRQEFESQRAGSEAAWRASHQDFHKVKP